MIKKDIKRVQLEPNTDLLHVLEDVNADGTPRLIEREGEPLAVVINPGDYRGADIEPKSKRFKPQLLALAGIWRDLDGDAMIADVYKRRYDAPPSPPVEL